MKRTSQSILIPLFFLLSLCAPACAGIVYTISPVTTNPQAGDNNDIFDVLATNNGQSDVTVGGFAFEVTTNSPSITLVSADYSTTVDPYIFAGNSLFGAVLNTTSGAVLDASDVPAAGTGTDLLSDETLALGEVLYDVAPGASGSFDISFSGDSLDNNASDASGNQIPVDSSATQTLIIGATVATPEPSSWLLFSAGAALLFWLKHGRRAERRQIAGAVLAVAGIAGAGSAQAQDRAVSPVHGPRGVQLKKARHQAGGTIASAGTPTCSSPHLTYYTGPVVSAVAIVPVNWSIHVNASIQTNIAQFYQDFTNSSYMDAIGEYSTAGLPSGNQEIVRGGSAAAITLTPSLCGGTANCRVSDAQIQAELLAQIKSGVLPPPTLDSTGQPNTYYPINFPPNVSVSGPAGSGNSCVNGGFCAYHNTGTYGTSSTPLLYAVVMDTFVGGCSTGCGLGTALEDYTSVAGHELIEAITDADIGLLPDTATTITYPVGWYDSNCGEVADICDNDTLNSLTVSGRTWNVQGFWSNRENACVVSGPTRTAPPITWSNPAPITPGTPLSSKQLNATATVAGSFVYNPPIGTILSSGTQTLNVTFTPDDPSDYTLSTASVTIDVTSPPNVVSVSAQFGSQKVNLFTSPARLPWQITGMTVTFDSVIASANTGSLEGFPATGLSGLGTNTLTWTSNPITLGTFSLFLDPNTIKNADGIGMNVFFQFHLNVLTGDVNNDGVVNTSDLVLVNAARTQSYNIFDDIDGNGVVNTGDVSLVRAQLGKSLLNPVVP